MNITDKITITNEDNMELMARYPDNYFDLAIVDPPYGISMMSAGNLSRGKQAKAKDYKKIDDSTPPNAEYFKELERVSKNQIIWGANHMMDLIGKRSSCWVVWQKNNGTNDFADAELAYTSFTTAVRVFDFTWNGMIQGDMKNKEVRIHITQKPAALYRWLLDKYATEGDKILDTHLGSGSIAIACHDYGFELTACELDPDYYDKAIKRIKNHISQLTLF